MFMARDVSLTMGSLSSVPKSDQVPLLRKAKLSPCAGTAVIADCVSWPQTLITFTGSSPISSHISRLSTPFCAPEGTIGVRISPGIPSLSSRSYAQS